MPNAKKATEALVYGVLVVLALAALGLFVALPPLSLVTSLVYQGF
jgi:hypothetical protein